MPLLEAVIFSSLWAFGLGQATLKQHEISVSRARDKSAHISCNVSAKNFNSETIYWYRQKPDQEIEYLTDVITDRVQVPLDGKNNKFEASKNTHTSTSTLKINFLEKEDEAIYYCGSWNWIHSITCDNSGWIKMFAQGTKLIVIPPDRSLNVDISPKPTTFLPSVTERELHQAGTYLCLLEDFFPDVIKIDWREKDDKTNLASQQGDTVKTNNTYMKFSWLTVSGASMDKEHKCIVKHEWNKGGVDQEILFPPQKKDLTAINSTKASLRYKDDTLQLQFKTTSALYTYLLLLFKSLIYSVIVAICLLGRPAFCGNGKSTNTWWHKSPLFSNGNCRQSICCGSNGAFSLTLLYFNSDVSFSIVSLLQNRFTHHWVNRNFHFAARTNSAMTLGWGQGASTQGHQHRSLLNVHQLLGHPVPEPLSTANTQLQLHLLGLFNQITASKPFILHTWTAITAA
ncbi:LOW QUALITY PROTEIN: uncharacterized protein LOC101692750 [Mustela putorius furo]|uniref:LOW QUALITY PROTEIN: uncharacterized protein LOC101692750 n=2 Tax=Mustela putorius furo TaxID=9669 RepID=A0A8U0V9Y0_MUSPF|nr:LOW QUALITY PROTEIN: uncharacterized protein LOC101692750 [Mustela putorius furo]